MFHQHWQGIATLIYTSLFMNISGEKAPMLDQHIWKGMSWAQLFKTNEVVKISVYLVISFKTLNELTCSFEQLGPGLLVISYARRKNGSWGMIIFRGYNSVIFFFTFFLSGDQLLKVQILVYKKMPLSKWTLCPGQLSENKQCLFVKMEERHSSGRKINMYLTLSGIYIY